MIYLHVEFALLDHVAIRQVGVLDVAHDGRSAALRDRL